MKKRPDQVQTSWAEASRAQVVAGAMCAMGHQLVDVKEMFPTSNFQ